MGASKNRSDINRCLVVDSRRSEDNGPQNTAKKESRGYLDSGTPKIALLSAEQPIHGIYQVTGH